MVTYQGKEYEELPDFARAAMAANLSRVVSLWFANHPEVYETFLDWKKKKEAEKASEVSA